MRYSVLGSLLFGLWFAHGLYREGLRWLERALERSRHDRIRGAACGRSWRRRMLAVYHGDYARAARSFPEAWRWRRELGEPLLVGQCLTIAGFLAYRQGDYGHAEELLNEAIARLSQLSDTYADGALPDSGFALLILGEYGPRSGAVRAAPRNRYEAALDHFQRAGNRLGD